MNTLTITTNTADDANFLATFLKTVKTVKSVVVDKKSEPSVSKVSEPEGEPRLDNKQIQRGKYNWTNPSRPATDEEFEQMILEAEKGVGITTKQLKKKFKQWSKEKTM